VVEHPAVYTFVVEPLKTDDRSDGRRPSAVPKDPRYETNKGRVRIGQVIGTPLYKVGIGSQAPACDRDTLELL
jgi:hypothetical protein